MIRLNCFIQVDESHREAVLEAAKNLVAASLNDAGCISYDILTSATQHGSMMICETWQDEASLDAHSNSKHFTTLVPQIESMAKMTIEKFQF